MTKILRRLEGNTWNTWGIVDIIDDDGTEVLGSDTNGGGATVDKASVVATGVLASDLGGVTSAQMAAATATSSGWLNTRLTWAPPVLTNPIEISLTTAGVTTLTAGQDYILKLPSAGPLKVSGGIQIVGGRNVVLIGGEIQIPASAVPNGPNYENLRAALFQGQTGTIHIEGVKVTAEAGGILNEGFDFIAPNAIVQIQNCRVEHLTRPDLQHCDVIQPYGGVAELRVDKLTGSSIYQGITLKNDTGTIGAAHLKRVNIIGEATAGNFNQYFWQHSSDIPVTLEEFFIQPPSFQVLLGAVWPNQSGVYPRRSFAQADGTIAWPAATNIKGSVQPGPPPAGDFVPSASVGVGYSSPGYANMAMDSTLTAEAGRAKAAEALLQPLDADLTAVAAIDSTVAGALVTDGAGWVRKTYAQLKTALVLGKGDVGLGNVDNTSDANKPVSTAQAAADTAVQTAAASDATGKVGAEATARVAGDALAVKKDTNSGLVPDSAMSPRWKVPKAQGAVCFTFDDGYSYYDSIRQLMNANGQRGTFYISSDYIDGGGAKITSAQLLALANDGHEIGDHTKSHANLTGVAAGTIGAELDASKTAIEAVVGAGKVNTFAYPFGATGRNATLDLEVASRYFSARSVANFVGDGQPMFLFRSDRPGEMTPLIAAYPWGTNYPGDADNTRAHANVLNYIRLAAKHPVIFIVLAHDPVAIGPPTDAQIREALNLAASLGVPALTVSEAFGYATPVLDPGFEDTTMAAWLKQGTAAETANIITDPALSGYYGSTSLHLNVANIANNVYVTQPVPIVPGRAYTFGGHARVAGLSAGTPGLVPRLRWKNFDGTTTINSVNGTALTSTNNGAAYAPISVTATAPVNAAYAQLDWLLNGVTGDAYVSHCFLQGNEAGAFG